MRNMSFQLTKDQFLNRTKTVTRRLGWSFLKPGQELMGCEKCMGLKKGEKVRKLGRIRIQSVIREPLSHIAQRPLDPALEGFPGMSPSDFIGMFVKHMHCQEETIVTRIEFEHLD